MTPKRKPGRRPEVGAARSVVVVLRLTPEEHARMAAKARAAGISLGPWMRMVALRSAPASP